jgi:hypothetical protein
MKPAPIPTPQRTRARMHGTLMVSSSSSKRETSMEAVEVAGEGRTLGQFGLGARRGIHEHRTQLRASICTATAAATVSGHLINLGWMQGLAPFSSPPFENHAPRRRRQPLSPLLPACTCGVAAVLAPRVGVVGGCRQPRQAQVGHRVFQRVAPAAARPPPGDDNRCTVA